MPTALAPALAVEHKTFNAPLLGAPEDETGVITALVAVFNNVDSGNDRILPGFFAKSIARKLPKGVWGHDWETPIAKTLEARELHPGDPMLPPGLSELGGLLIKGQFNLATQRGREAYEDIKFGIIDEFSIGFRATQAETDKKTGVRDLIEGDLFEWSPVLVGMNSRTRLLSIKSHRDQSPREVNPVAGKTFLESSREMVAVIGEYGRRAEDRIEFRIQRGRKKSLPDAEKKAGRVLSRQTEGEITSVADAAEALARQLRELLARANPQPADEPAADAEKAVEPATPAVPHVTAPAGPEPPTPSPAPPGPDDADILAMYIATRRAATLALAGATLPCPTH